MSCTSESCKGGLTTKCFAECAKWAKQAFCYRLLHMLVRAEITRRLPKGLYEALIAPGVDVPPEIVLPPGTIVSPETIIPPDWVPPVPMPPHVKIEPRKYISPGWMLSDPLPDGMLGPPEKYTPPIGRSSESSVMAPMTLGLGAGSMLGGGSSRGGFGGAGCGCCKSSADPAQNVSIGYETAEMELNGAQEMTVENANIWCEGHFYEWMITSGGGELSTNEGLSVIYTAPTSGHGCPGNTEITLFCCGEVMGALDITINYDYSIEYNCETSAETIARETSELIYAIANNTPLTWSVVGTGFSLEHAETDGVGNVLHADETACGAAIITITGCDEQNTTGHVRCTTGSWVQKDSGTTKPTPCYLSGAATGYSGRKAEIIEGNKRYCETISHLAHCSPGDEPCGEDCGRFCITQYDCGNIASVGWWEGDSLYDGCCCKNVGCIDYYSMEVDGWTYYEWEC